jgi:hypothetical protein
MNRALVGATTIFLMDMGIFTCWGRQGLRETNALRQRLPCADVAICRAVNRLKPGALWTISAAFFSDSVRSRILLRTENPASGAVSLNVHYRSAYGLAIAESERARLWVGSGCRLFPS